MRLLVLASLLSFTNGSIHREQAHATQYETQIKQQQSTEPMPATPIHKTETGGEQGTSYDPRQDFLYRAYLAFTIIGVFVALGAIYVFYLQTQATQEAAAAAKQQADNITNSERAWVTVSVEIHSDHGDYDVVLTNHGSTPARIVEARGDLQPLHEGNSLPDGPSYQTDILPAKKLLAPKEEWGIHMFSPHPTVRYVAGGTERLDTEQFFIGYVAYRHIFDPEKSPPHYSRFCFRLEVNRTWQASGPSAYHEYS
jgi:archaellum component FlaF (FlaF/FlaG flagellin family)